MPVSFDTLRTGKRYFLKNFGEEFSFDVLTITDQDILVKDIFTLETYPLSDLVKYGQGKDYDLQEADPK